MGAAACLGSAARWSAASYAEDAAPSPTPKQGCCRHVAFPTGITLLCIPRPCWNAEVARHGENNTNNNTGRRPLTGITLLVSSAPLSGCMAGWHTRRAILRAARPASRRVGPNARQEGHGAARGNIPDARVRALEQQAPAGLAQAGHCSCSEAQGACSQARRHPIAGAARNPLHPLPVEKGGHIDIAKCHRMQRLPHRVHTRLRLRQPLRRRQGACGAGGEAAAAK